MSDAGQHRLIHGYVGIDDAQAVINAAPARKEAVMKKHL